MRIIQKIQESGSFLPMHAIIILIICLFSFHTYFFSNYVTDDAYISFRYLENLKEGKGLVYNPGEKVWGFTNFLWIMFLFPLTEMNIDPLLGARIIGVICNVLSLFLVLFGFGSLMKYGTRNILGSLFLVTHGAFLLQSMSGLETSFFTLLVLYALYILGKAINKKSPRLFFFLGLIMALATLTRPEGLFLSGLLIGHVMISPKSVGLPLKLIMKRYLIGFLPVILAFVGSMFLYYGTFWPNSINAKVGFSSEQLFRGIRYFVVFAMYNPLSIILLLMTCLFFKSANALVRTVFLFILFFMVFNIFVGGDWMDGYRLFHTAIPLACLLIPFCMAVMQKKILRSKMRMAPVSKILAVSLIVIFSAINLLNSRLDPHVYRATVDSYVHEGIKIGKWMRENFKSDSLLATNTGGTIAYFSKLQIVDMMGINDTVIANRQNVPKEWKGIEKGDGKYVLSRRPDYIQFGSSTGSIEPYFLSDIEIFESEDFWKNYDLVAYSIDKKIKLLIYERREKEKKIKLSKERLRKIKNIVNRRMRRSAYRY